MHDVWKPVEVILSEQLSAPEIQAHLESQIRINACEAGEFVKAIRFGLGHHHGVGYRKWSASYLPGPPAAFPVTNPHNSADGPPRRHYDTPSGPGRDNPVRLPVPTAEPS